MLSWPTDSRHARRRILDQLLNSNRHRSCRQGGQDDKRHGAEAAKIVRSPTVSRKFSSSDLHRIQKARLVQVHGRSDGGRKKFFFVFSPDNATLKLVFNVYSRFLRTMVVMATPSVSI